MIKVTRRQYAIISRTYRFGGFALILGLLIGFSWLIGKPIEFLLIFLPYFLTKGIYAKQYHSHSLKECFGISLFAFGVATFLCVLGIVQEKLKDYDYIEPRYNKLVAFYKNATKSKPFDVNTCTEEELRKRCEELRFSQDNTDLAVEFFIRKTKQSIIADRLCIDEKSVTTRKKRLKAKLQQTCNK